jgi:hypothetical protein
LFILLRGAVVPKSFGKYGHYRADALEEIRLQPLRHAGHELCAGCHTDQAAVKEKGKHRGVTCEACHGPAAAHGGDPGSGKPVIAAPDALCARCHEKHPAKPQWFKQVAVKEHYAGAACISCHQSHSPGF